MKTRADRIFEILGMHDGRMKVGDIAKNLEQEERVKFIHPSTVSATVRQDNSTHRTQGMTLRFNHSGDGSEEWGYVSLRRKAAGGRATGTSDDSQVIQESIEKANNTVRLQLKKAIGNLSWQEFESNFLERVLDAFGFNEVQITQPTRDGGKDAICTYTRGIISSKAIISAKHWAKGRVGVKEVRDLRGQKGDADTGVIITSSDFTEEAKQEAAPGQNQRTIVLVDGDLIVEACLVNTIGVEGVSLPTLYKFSGFEKSE